MLQRIQTVYLLLASICMVVSLLTNLAVFSFDGNIVHFEAMGFYMNQEIIFPTWGLFVIGNISAILSVGIVFLYKKRMLQIRLASMNIFIILGYLYYPPLISISCIFSIIVTWIFMIKKINILKLI